MISSSKENVQEFVAHCLARQITHIVISPGSRNAPLVIAFNRNPNFKTYVVHDERSAGFIALGIIQTTGKAVAVCCTSGSAVCNYYPAVVEAYYRNLPLLVVSADRPKEWIDQGDGQTIKQNLIFGNHVLYNVYIEDKVNSKSDKWLLHRELNALFTQLKNGPCHVNIAFNEPLYTLTEIEETQNLPEFDLVEEKDLCESSFAILEESLWNKKTIIILGQSTPNAKLKRILVDLSYCSNIVVLVENTSNVSGGNIIHCIDRTLNMISKDQEIDFHPETIVHLGGPIISKRIKQFLRAVPLRKVIRVAPHNPIEDTFQGLTHAVSSKETSFLIHLKKHTRQEIVSTFSDQWRTLDLRCRDKIDVFASKQNSLNDWFVFYLVHQYLPEGCCIHQGNSSVVRYMQLFEPIKEAHYFANRGTSGIDGSLSTAVGSALAQPEKEHFLLIGDISFIYDSNALWFTPFPTNLKVIIVNNSGGGIFRIIEGANSSDELERYFEATHQQNCKEICLGFGKECQQINTLKHLEPHIASFIQTKGSAFIEIQTEQKLNPQILHSFFNFMRQ